MGQKLIIKLTYFPFLLITYRKYLLDLPNIKLRRYEVLAFIAYDR
jgi:hypothetical protein